MGRKRLQQLRQELMDIEDSFRFEPNIPEHIEEAMTQTYNVIEEEIEELETKHKLTITILVIIFLLIVGITAYYVN